MRSTTALAAALLIAACGQSGEAPDNAAATNEAVDANAVAPGNAAAPAAGWDLVASGEGTALVYPSGEGRQVTLFCPAGRDEILVNVPGFRPVGSEERLSFGSGGTVAALVADTSGDRLRGGVSGAGAVPAELAALIAGPVAVNYGAQNSGPHPAPPADLARGFVAACREGAAATPPAPAPAPNPSPPAAGACRMQGEQRLANPALRAVGTEPFWGARIEGRCVTYSHPDDQAGTRVWTRYAAGQSGGGSWTGALNGRRFVLTVRPQPGCSDGMSDKRYPYAAELLLGAERRTGCAERP